MNWELKTKDAATKVDKKVDTVLNESVVRSTNALYFYLNNAIIKRITRHLCSVIYCVEIKE